MVIGDRLKTLREAKNLSQGDIEKRTGLLRCYGDKSPALPKSAKLSTEDSLESSRSGALLMEEARVAAQILTVDGTGHEPARRQNR